MEPMEQRTMIGKISLAAAVLLAISFALPPSPAGAAPRTGRSKSALKGPVQEYSSQHFLIYTDLSADKVRDLLRKLEDELKLTAAYWGRPPRGIIECCVVDDLSKWPQELIAKMEPQGLAKIREGAGVCIGVTRTMGNKFVGKAHVYAVAKDNVPLHEAVHAYCDQAFGRTGAQMVRRVHGRDGPLLGKRRQRGERPQGRHPLPA